MNSPEHEKVFALGYMHIWLMHTSTKIRRRKNRCGRDSLEHEDACMYVCMYMYVHIHTHKHGLWKRTKDVLMHESLREETSGQSIVDFYDLRPEFGIQK